MKKTKINSFSDLKKLIEKIKLSDSPQPIVVNSRNDENQPVSVSIPTNKTSIIHRTLMEGFDLIKNREEWLSKAKVDKTNEDYGGIVPTDVPQEDMQFLWVDRFIDQHFNGKREGYKIVWDLPEGKFELDPWSLTLNKSS